MKEELFTDEALEAALSSVQQKHLESLSDSREPYEFSDEFEQKMSGLLKQERRRSRLRHSSRWAVAAVLAVAVGLGLFLTVRTEAGADALTWLRREYQHYTSYLFRGESGELPRYTLTWIPEGCELYKEDTAVDQTLVYYDPAEPPRSFTVSVMPLGDDHGIVLGDTQNAELTTLQIRSCPAQLYTFPDHQILVWIDEDAGAVFTITGTVTTEELLQIAEGLAPEK